MSDTTPQILKPKRRIPRVRISRVLTGLVLGLSALALAGSVIGTYTGWWRITPVKTGSMRPGIPVDSVIVAVSTNIEDVKAGDVILFKAPTAPYEMIVHRIVEIKTDRGEKVFKTKGDANNVSDPWAVKLKGAKVWTLAKVFPRLGTPLRWFADPLVRLIVVVTIGLIALMFGMVWIWTDGDEPRGFSRAPLAIVGAGVLVVSILGATKAFASFNGSQATSNTNATGTLAAPSSLACAWTSSTNVKFTWTNPSLVAPSGYDLLGSPTTGTGYTVRQSTVGAAALTANDANSTTLKYYVAQAKKSTAWTSGYSNEMVTNRCTGAIYAMAGTGVSGTTGDGGQATAATLQNPWSVAVDSVNKITYVGDSSGRVRAISAAGVITLAAGGGASTACNYSGVATGVKMTAVYSLAVDSTGAVFIGDSFGCIRKLSGGNITSAAGGGASTACNYAGASTGLKVQSPYGLAVDSSGAVYFSDFTMNCVRKLSGGVISQFAGGGATTGCTATGTATAAVLSNPLGLSFDAAGNMLIAEYTGACVRKVSAGKISSVAGTGPGTASACSYTGPVSGLVLALAADAVTDASGNIFVSEWNGACIRKIDTTALTVSQVSGSGTGGSTGDNGSATGALVQNPFQMAFAINGDLLFADYSNNRVREIVGPL